MQKYSFATIWKINAPLPQVWEALAHPRRWPDWWKGCVSVVELERGRESGVDSVWACTWKSTLPYSLRFDCRISQIVEHAYIECIACGELEGVGRFYLSEHGPITVVRYEWQVATIGFWMNLLAPLARPLFIWNHNILMRQGGEGLAHFLGARLLNPPPPMFRLTSLLKPLLLLCAGILLLIVFRSRWRDE